MMIREVFEKQQAQIEHYTQRAEAGSEMVNGDEGEDFRGFAKKLKAEVLGNV